MDLMELINNWKKVSGMNSPMLPGQPPQATPPFVPQPGQGGYQPQSASSPFGQKDPLQTITPPDRSGRFPEVSAPQRDKVGIDSMLPEVTTPKRAGVFQEVETPDRKPIYAQNDIWQMKNMDKKWHKDGDFMNELGAA